MGSFFGGMLARAGAPVTFFGRPRSASPHLAAIRQDGLVIDGPRIRETIEVTVAENLAEIERAELVLFAVKSPDTESAAGNVQGHLAAGALVVSLQNGIENV
ncbi:MAG: 2-dehydropantoate 2-reductase, partial [Actinomycetia bacterium]|nr:2-dehydropantoate 2-reductase [Actinomycetes bacterium]